MKIRLRSPWAVFVGIGVLVSCADAFNLAEERQLERALARWAAADLQDYQVEVRLTCFCQAALPGFSRLTVLANRVVAAELLMPSPEAQDIPLDAWPTVLEVFDLIESASDQSDYTDIEVEYDPTLGYPNRLELRCTADVVDCGALYELQNVTQVSGGS